MTSNKIYIDVLVLWCLKKEECTKQTTQTGFSTTISTMYKIPIEWIRYA